MTGVAEFLDVHYVVGPAVRYVAQGAPERYLYSLPDIVARNEPATRKPRVEWNLPVTPKMEAYVRAIGHLLNPGMDPALFEQFFKSMYAGNRFVDNGNGYESGHWKWTDLFCAGANFLPTSDELDQGFLTVHCIDYYHWPDPPATLADIDMTLHYFPTISRSTGNEPFRQFGGRWLQPFWSKGDTCQINFYPDEGRGGLAWVDRLQHPFIPPRPDITLLGLA